MEKKQTRLQINRAFLIAWLIIIFTFTACSPRISSEPAVPTATEPLVAETPSAAPSLTPTDLPTLTLTPTLSPAPTEAPTPTLTETATQIPTETPTVTLTPTYAILRGEVLVRSNCRYGPGEPYLYKYGLVVGSNLEVIGRNDMGTWILVRAIGGNNPCWVKASLMDVKGDVMAVEPTYISLPQSPYYGPVTGVSAARSGYEVTIFWNPISFRAGDDTASAPYLVEAWVCVGGQLVFTPIGTYEPAAMVIDEPGCAEPSHGRVFGVEKHGYTRWVEILWPPHQ